jgi:hypothetical protein
MSAARGGENPCRNKVIIALDFGTVSDAGIWPTDRETKTARKSNQSVNAGRKQMKYRVMLCGGLLATAVLLSFPHASSALPAAPSALLPAVHSSDLIAVRGGGGGGRGGGGGGRGGGGGGGHARMGGGGGAAHARTGGGNVNRSANVNRNVNQNVNRNVNRNVNVNRHVGVGGGAVRPWVRRPYFGTIVGGVALGTLIAVSVAPVAPAPNLCWYWADPSQTQGYWDYCQ